MTIKTILPILILVLISACSTKEDFIVLSQSEDGSVGALQLDTAKGSMLLDEPGMALIMEDGEQSQAVPISEDETTEIFNQALAVQPLTPLSYILYFDFNSKKLTSASKETISEILQAVSARNCHDIAVIGHTDRTGDDAYNQTLSLNRAKTVYNLLLENNLKDEDINISYHGEGNPLIPTKDNVAEPRNRRVEVMVR